MRVQQVLLLLLLLPCASGIDPASSALECPSAGCWSAQLPGSGGGVEVSPGETVSLAVPASNGDARSANVFVPSSALDPTPGAGPGERAIVFVLHGNLGTAEQIELSTEFSELAEEEGFIVVYPQGLFNSWNAFGCCGLAAATGVDDVLFLSELLDLLLGSLCVDQRRVYFTGISNGALMAYRLAQLMPERIAAIGPVAGVPSEQPLAPAPIAEESPVADERGVSVIHVHGSFDTVVPYGLPVNPLFFSLASTLDAWEDYGGCDDSEEALYFEQGPGLCIETAVGCKINGTSVVLCTISGGGHNWPGGTLAGYLLGGYVGFQSTLFKATNVMWEFFKDHPSLAKQGCGDFVPLAPPSAVESPPMQPAAGPCAAGDGTSLAAPSGDITGDGLVNIQDIVLVVEVIANGLASGQIAPPNCAFLVADVDSNGILNIQDVIFLLDSIA